MLDLFEQQYPQMHTLAFGGGTDSTAILGGWVERGLPPFDVILFADTGGELPHTYTHIERMNEWLPRHGLPPIITVRKAARTVDDLTLEGSCLRGKVLPSLAYGFKTCSQKYKIQPQDKFFNNNAQAKAVWKAGGKVTKYVGYEFSETRRWMKEMLVDNHKYVRRFPLVEWEWSRPECVAAIKRMGLPLPGKSSCFFCPASTKQNINALKNEYPLLFRRAIAMEENAVLRGVKGLGRRFSWRDYATTKEEPTVTPCLVCVDES